jgi:hypothetical protein
MKKSILVILVVLIMVAGATTAYAVPYNSAPNVAANGTSFRYLCSIGTGGVTHSHNNCTTMSPNNYNCRWIVNDDDRQLSGYWHNVETKYYSYRYDSAGREKLSVRTDTEQDSSVDVIGSFYH